MSTPKLITLVSQFYATLLIPGVYVVIMLVTFYTKNYWPDSLRFLETIESQIVLLIVCLLGCLLWLSSYIALGSSFGVLPKAVTRVSRGPYKYVDHPMYVGIFLTFSSLTILMLSWPGFLLNLLLLTPINIVRAKKESALLRSD